MCEVINTVRASKVGPGCQSDKRCFGANEVCCKDVITEKANPEYERLLELESDVKEALQRVRKALEEVRGNEKAVSLLEKISSTLESVLDKLSTLMLGEGGSLGDLLAQRSTFNEVVAELGITGPNRFVEGGGITIKANIKVELESEVREGLKTVVKALEEVRGNNKAVSLLEKIRSTLESVFDKISSLIDEDVNYDDLTPKTEDIPDPRG